MAMTGAQALWAALVREGVTDVFGYPGGAILPAYDAMLEFPIHHVLVRHEQGATHMADGYARASGRVGVAIATSGPGATNMVTGIATAMLDSSPIVCITGQVGSKLIGSDAFQETDITGITLPITKHNYLVTRAEDVAGVIREAFAIAASGRPGPVLVDITKDAQTGSCEVDWDATEPHLTETRDDAMPGDGTAAEALALINASERPLILAGHGVTLSGAEREIVALAEKARIPIAVTLLGIGGVPASHPLNLGMMGMHGEAWVNTAIQEADLLLALGMRFDDRVTGNLRTYALNAKKIHVDIDRAELNKNVRVDVAIAKDLRGAISEWLPKLAPNPRTAWHARINDLKGDSAVRDIQNLPDNGHLYAAHVINDLWRLTDGNAVVVTDVGQHQMWEAQYYKHDAPRSLITSGGLGTMGFALPAAIGAKMARPDAEVWVVVGDGGFQMTMCELATAVQEGLDINIAIINNGYLGMVRQWQEFFYQRRYAATPITGPDFFKLAQAFGIWGRTIDQRADVEEAVNEARRQPGVSLIDFRVEQEDSVYPMVPAGADLDKMIRRPSPSPIVETAAD
jgi:acetolactate synthase-1/2/3 large subunit